MCTLQCICACSTYACYNVYVDVQTCARYNVYVHVQPMHAIMYWGAVDGGTTPLPFSSASWKREIPTLPCCVLRAASYGDPPTAIVVGNKELQKSEHSNNFFKPYV